MLRKHVGLKMNYKNLRGDPGMASYQKRGEKNYGSAHQEREEREKKRIEKEWGRLGGPSLRKGELGI